MKCRPAVYAWLVLAGWLPGCSGEEKPERRDPLPDAIVVTREPVLQDRSPSGRESVRVHLKFFNISDLHRSFFTQEEAMRTLGEGLAQCSRNDAEVLISYDSEARVGRIIYVIPSTAEDCLPTSSNGGVDLLPLRPIGESLASFRDYVAGTRDFRIANFRVGVHFARGLNVCELTLGGQYPPTGESWSPCVSFAGKEKCASNEEGTTFLRFPAATDQGYLKNCLGLL